MTPSKKPTTHGGRREGAGRPPGERHCRLTIYISQAAADALADKPNKSAYIDALLTRK